MGVSLTAMGVSLPEEEMVVRSQETFSNFVNLAQVPGRSFVTLAAPPPWCALESPYKRVLLLVLMPDPKKRALGWKNTVSSRDLRSRVVSSAACAYVASSLARPFPPSFPSLKIL